MIRTRQILNDFRETGALHACLAPFAFIGDEAFVTKAGDIGMVLAVRAVDYECLDPEELDAVSHRFQSAIRIFDERFIVYQYLIKRDNPVLPQKDYPENPVLQQALSARIAHLRDRADRLYEIETWFVILRKGATVKRDASQMVRQFLTRPVATLSRLFSSEGRTVLLERELEREQAVLRNRVESFSIQMADLFDARILSG